MKHELRIVIISLLLFRAIITSAQQCDSKGITTDPRNNFANSINNELPSKRNTFFDWTTPTYQINSSKIAASQIESPFFQGPSNSNVLPLFSNKDMQPGDGWELIKHDLGYNENGTAKNPPVDYIYLVLYNKYTGVMRIFLAGDAGTPFNGATISLEFANSAVEKYSSILSNASTIYALDRFDANPKIISVNRYLNGLGKWFYADFQMAYDACTCFYESALTIYVKLINQADVDITGSFTGEIATINSNAGSVSDPNYSLQDIITGGKKAQKAYKDGLEFTTSVEKSLGISTKTDAQLTAQELARRNALNQFRSQLASSDFLKAGLKAIPIISSVVELFDFFTGGGKESSGPIELMPMSINATIKVAGTIVAAYPYRDASFYVPGSKNAHIKDPALYPYYNEVLGVINSLTTPELTYSETNGEPYFHFWTSYLSIMPEIVLNPASGFDPATSEVMGTIIYEKNPDGTAKWHSGYFPLAGLQRAVVISNGFTQPELKLVFNLRRLNSSQQTQNVLLVMTFPLATRYCANCSTQAPNPILFNATNGMANGITEVITTTKSNYSTSPWNEVSVRPGGRILPNSTLSVNAQLRELFTYPMALPLATASRVNEFCVSSAYTLPLRNPGARTVSDEVQLIDAKTAEDKSFRTSPNPASGKIVYRYYVEEASTVTLTLRDVSGKIIRTLVDEFQEIGQYQLTQDISQIQPGLYLSILETNRGREISRIVVIN